MIQTETFQQFYKRTTVNQLRSMAGDQGLLLLNRWKTNLSVRDRYNV